MRIFILDKSYSGESDYILRKREKDYLIKVLRLKVGDIFTCKDINNNYYDASIISEDMLSLTPTENPEEHLLDSFSAYRDAIPPIRVYQAICKGKKNETIIRMLTEAGVEEIVFITSQFSQEKGFKEHDLRRLSDIQKEAVQQSGSNTKVRDIRVIDIKDVISDSPYPIFFLHQSSRGKTQNLLEALKNIKSYEISIIIGSEGGISDEECEFLENNNATPILLPTNILRAETAGIFAIGAIETLLSNQL
ncbi:MAG: RsmE family RNA methyltransferase [Spirochaetales bacterium]|uniref:RsmE family RNA methyltransferase n=1 Tax=Bullifex sp. TaxID=2815808 RepID=UPI002A54C7E7|nr:RsmE family RNA methyltransferase [Bullifex sp.]MDD5973740.1 RsmE family RNA methyltransferase [Spirochaetales bacterium]MDD7270447.1 RsmE family RNA methyltransferase [Spirochaetales bacterium]MDY4068192.1 RsmE family RNA methyltransferase [Bullifex sp.]